MTQYGFGFTSDWMKKWRESFRANHVAQSTHNQLLFDTQMKTALYSYYKIKCKLRSNLTQN